MAAGLLGGLGSERRLARSVAHLLKYYIEVQRKENSFQSSGLLWDEAENFYLHPAYLTEQRTKEHNFAKIKLEAFLRAYTGNAEECNRKIQGNLAKQKEVEKLIKKMARDYVPDRINEMKMKSRTRPNKVPASLSKLYLNAVPRMSPEEVKRLVSSASKLIVAATSKMEEKMETTQGPKRRETKSFKCFRKKDFPTVLRHENQARRGQESRTRQSDKEINGKAKASNPSGTSPAKSKRILSVAAWNTQLKNSVPSSKGIDNVGMRSRTSFKIRKQGSSSRSVENVSSKNCPSRKPLALKPSQALGSKACEDRLQCSAVWKTKKKEVSKGNRAHPSARSTAEIYSSQPSTSGKKTGRQFSPETVSRSPVLKRASNPKPRQNDPGEKLVKCMPRNGFKDDLLSRTTSKRHQANFANWESLGLERGRRRGPHEDGEDGGTAASHPETCGLAGSIKGGCNSATQQGPTFLHELCQEMTGGVGADQTGSKSNQSFSWKEPRVARPAEDHVNSLRVVGESGKQGAICIPPRAPAGCRCSELPNYCTCEIKEEQEIGFPGKTTALLKSLGREQPDDEFSGLSLSSSARSSSWLCKQRGDNMTPKESVTPKMVTFL